MTNEQILEFDTIKKQLEQYAFTAKAKEKIKALEPFLAEKDVTAALRETSEARVIIDQMGNPPLTSLDEMNKSMDIALHGGCLTEEQLEQADRTLGTVKRLKEFLNRCKQLEVSLPYYEENLDPLDDIRDEINRVIRNGRVDDYASKTLKDCRAEMERLKEKIHEKAEAVLRANRSILSDSMCVLRNGYLCIPVKRQFKSKVDGRVIDESSTGSTLFITPKSVEKLSEELSILEIEEENEVYRILYTLTALLAEQEAVLTGNQTMIEKLDFIFAKGKLSAETCGIEPEICEERTLCITNGRHPLMERETAVPLNVKMEEGIKGVVITGPNTGGKTVAIKTIGLTCMMAQSGLHVCCERATLCMNNYILCDIGDGQNIHENLSTFSSHIMNVLDILKKADRESLVIMDELGSGTDPMEGMGIAIAILEELKKSGALYFVTTHYPEVKTYVEKTEGVINARMTFDRESLRPLYQLKIGEAGESCAFYIAKKLGMPGSMLKRASEAAYGKDENPMLFDETEQLHHDSKRRLQKPKPVRETRKKERQFQLGDSVMVYPEHKIGIVCKTEDERGMLRVQIAKEKIWINHKRIKLHVAAGELYPEDYDFSILFDSVAVRKARHKMERKYDPDAQIIEEE